MCDPTPYQLRQAGPDDAACLSALSTEVWLATYAQHGVSDDYARYVQDEYAVRRFAELLTTNAATILVAHNGPFVGGYLRYAANTDPALAAYGEVEIVTLYVRAAQQKRGLGRALLQAALARCRADRVESVYLKVNAQNARALAFYEAMGMQDRGPWTFMLGALAVPNRIWSCTP